MNTLSFPRLEISRRDTETLRDSFGPLVWSRLEDFDVTDVLLNPDGSLYEDRYPTGLTRIGSMSENDALSIIHLVAAIAGETVVRGSPIVESELPIRNARFIGFIPPVSLKPSFAIRLPPNRIHSLASYVENGFATPRQIEAIETAIYQEQNILISGGTGSGKSTLMNAVLDATHKTYPDKRICIIEEIVELQYARGSNTLALRAGAQMDQQLLLKRLMRARPDIIVFGEVLDRAAMQLIKAANTGHGSVMSTVHASSPRRATGRLEDLCAEALPGVSVRSQIADALGIIIGIERTDPAARQAGEPSRRITEIVKVKGTLHGDYDFVTLA